MTCANMELHKILRKVYGYKTYLKVMGVLNERTDISSSLNRGQIVFDLNQCFKLSFHVYIKIITYSLNYIYSFSFCR